MSTQASVDAAPSGGGALASKALEALEIFAGQGEMAALIRSTNWSETPLGPIDTWPQSLRTAVSICLGSRHPIVLWWGTERWMFYNDGYRPMLGERHPHFLGRPGQECWAEIWDIIGPMMDSVIATGEATWSEDFCLLMRRSGYLEETYYTFSYSPIRDERGRPSGIFNACTESTGRVIADRRMKTLRQTAGGAQTTAEAVRLCAEPLGKNPRDIPFFLLYLADHDGAELHLVAEAGLARGTSASPLTVAVAAVASVAADATKETNAEDETSWPLARVIGSGRAEVVTDLARRFDALPKEPWGEPAHQAMLLPIARRGSNLPAGVLVLGISPRRAFDDDYSGFFELVGDHVATALSNARAYEEERERAEKLAELDRVKTTFFSNVSHEFRTPLTLILGPLEDALADPSKSLRGENLGAVHRSALRLLRLVNSLLDFSRVEAGRLEPHFEPTDLSALTAGLAGSFQSLVESAGLTLEVDCPPLPEAVYVDPSQWEKIALNLLSNAFKFTFDGALSVRLRAVGPNVELTVQDTGSGIPPADLSKVFERFYRVEGAPGRTFEGSGIGLSLVQELVRQHQGSIRVESVVGKGSSFVVTIPRGKDHLPQDHVSSAGAWMGSAQEVADLGVAAATPFLLEARAWGATDRTRSSEPGHEAPDASSARVLVADDNADMREYLVRLLAPRWNVEAVADGQAALEAALERPPDLILSDVMMPRMDGVGLLRALRANEATRTIPFVLLSARAGEEAVVSGLETGADDYLVKPFSARELLGRVGTHLEMARLRRQAIAAATELAETRAVLLEDLDRKNKELETFSYSVSHDLRAPLRRIDGFSHALVEEFAGALGDDGTKYLSRVVEATAHMAELIDDLLSLAHVASTPICRAEVDLTALARGVSERLMAASPERDGQCTVTIQEGVRGNADSRLLGLVLENLLGNAWKFTAKRAKAEITFGFEERDGKVTYFVEDNGAGFDAAHAAKLFGAFQRYHAGSDFEGTGIGLATVQRAVHRHDGRVWAESTVDGGAKFSFTLGSERK